MRTHPQMRELTLTFALLFSYTGCARTDEYLLHDDIVATHFAVVPLNSF